MAHEHDPDLRAAIEEATAPKYEEVLNAKELILQRLKSGGAVLTNELKGELLAARGLNLHENPPAIQLPNGPFGPLNRDEPSLEKPRILRAFDLAVADLESAGIVMDAEISSDDIQIQWGSNGFGFRLRVDRRPDGAALRIPPRLTGQIGIELLDEARFTSDIEWLLGPRGLDCVREAVRSHRAGLYLATAVMLGGASEAAWYQIVDWLGDEKSSAFASSGHSGQMIEAALSKLRDRAEKATALVKEVGALETYLRDLRNYGAHPHRGRDEDSDVAFTEPGSTVLLVQSRKYLMRLGELVRAAGVAPTQAAE